MKKRVAITITDDNGNETLLGSKVVEAGPNGEISLPLVDIMKKMRDNKKKKYDFSTK